MTTARRTLALLASAVAVGGAAGCGSSEDAKKPTTLTAAKAALSKDCRGGKDANLKLCECVADRLAGGGRTAKQLLDLNDQVKQGKVPTVVTTALTACNKQLSGGS
ncbi:hypothetical protein DSM112329_01007 [Paraconexibacter sp. AEG42_29]|uniref:Uncharacterized protein n=1 Tax=Paraconexibacter sp. AEG42_29 TaxID=2997339 RepID=A0AAU7AR89_9ACTN